jgi:NAD(P)-dependent dehydrogenase (short-subunit alcohol dehydrogenase family)
MTALYSASKAALSALTGELLKEVAPLGIEVVLIEGGALGNTRMTQDLRRQADTPAVEGSPYRLLEDLFRIDWGSAPPGSEGWLSFASNNLANACTAPDPPFIFPPELQAWLEPAFRLSDEAFVRLASLDQSPDLYQDVAPFWMANLAVGQRTPPAAPPAV